MPRLSLSRRSLFLLLVLLVAIAAFAQSGTKKRRPLPDEYGNVTMNNFAQKSDEPPVVFSHWVHRSRFTCRLCHVDIGFAMTANATGVRESDNREGFYCGACHDGKTAFDVRAQKVDGREVRNCERCHSSGRDVEHDVSFPALSASLPRGRFGNNIDWEAAELEGKIRLVDTLPNVSVKRKPLQVQKDYSIEAKVAGLPEIVFSHKKHAVWHGCELCHPDIFTVKTGGTKFTMQEIFAGRYCGQCHGSVAFPATDCQRCHTQPVA